MDLYFNLQNSHISPAKTQRAILNNRKLIEQAQQGEIWNDHWLGWFSVSGAAPEKAVAAIQEEVKRVWQKTTTMIVIGIGGSNRGAKAAIKALCRKIHSPTRIVWAGDSLSSAVLKDVIEIVRNDSVMLTVIAKDFKTLEPGIAFRMLRQELITKYGTTYASRIVVIGSYGKGQLYEIAQAHGYRFLEFPESIGGRFSVLSNVGLFPMAVAGVDITRLLQGAAAMEMELKKTDVAQNPAVQYAMNRNILFSKGFGIESLVVFEPDLVPFAKWWTQLFAETEGKTSNAVFPTYFTYSEDLHAVGQYVQQGRRCITETFLGVFHKNPELMIEPSINLVDGFSYLDRTRFDELNQAVYAAALKAHAEDGVPCQEIRVNGIEEETLGELFYFFMFACYVSASLIKVNPFTQDGVENYKKAMQELLRSGQQKTSEDACQ